MPILAFASFLAFWMSRSPTNAAKVFNCVAKNMLVLMNRKIIMKPTKKRTAKVGLTDINGLRLDEPQTHYSSAPMVDNGLLNSSTIVPKITVMAKAKPDI